ncbi:MAG: hypothetical protein ACXV8A_00835 [Chthoniobacterales bacterium]
MKKLAAITLSLLGLVCVHSCLALDLTPNETSSNGNGPPVKRYFFNDADKKLTFRMDGKMSVSGTSDTVGFQFEDLHGAAMKMSRSPISATVPFDEKNLATYRRIAKGFLPGDANEVQIEEERSNPIAINGWTSHQFIFTYNLFGFAQRRSVTFLNYNKDEQFVIDVAAKANDYMKAYARGYRVLNSITDMPVSNSGPT